MKLVKAFDNVNLNSLLAKLGAYGLDNNAVSFMESYRTNRLQRCKINNSFSQSEMDLGLLQHPRWSAL